MGAVNVISKARLLDMLEGKSKDVQLEGLAWYRVAKGAGWEDFTAVRIDFPDADLVEKLLVFNGSSEESVSHWHVPRRRGA